MDLANLRQVATAAAADLWDQDGALTQQGVCFISAVITAIVSYVAYKSAAWFSPHFSSAYGQLVLEQRKEWDTRYFSCIHAVLVSYLSYLTLVCSDTFYEESDVPVMKRTSYLSYLNLGISLGYFALDLVICVKYKVGGKPMVFHHIASFCSVYWAAYSGFGHMPTVWLLGTEFTTPFINFRWWLDKAGMKSSRLYVYNGMTIVLTWFIARILIFVPFYVQVWSIKHELAVCDWPTRVLFVGVPVLLTCLNVFWFRQILKGAAKVLFIKQDAAKKEE